MDESTDKQYFEELADREIKDAEEPEEIELTKAQSATMSRAKAKEKEEIDLENGAEPEGTLTVDVYQTPSEIIVESAIAGVAPEDVEVNVTHDAVSIKGARRKEKRVRDEDYLYQECYWGRFARTIILPQEVDPEGAEVIFKTGILTVHLPKLNRQKAKRLKIKVE